MAAAKSLAGKDAFRIPYLFAAIFKLYSTNTAMKAPQTKAQYLITLEIRKDEPHGFRADVVTSPLRLGSFLRSIAAANSGDLFWGQKGEIVAY